MRPAADYLPSPDAKRLAVRELRAAGFDLRLAIDDDRRNVDMFHAEGIPCIYIHSGYYE
jgi:pyridoxine 5'-phosphate synthase PdxJ